MFSGSLKFLQNQFVLLINMEISWVATCLRTTTLCRFALVLF